MECYAKRGVPTARLRAAPIVVGQALISPTMGNLSKLMWRVEEIERLSGEYLMISAISQVIFRARFAQGSRKARARQPPFFQRTPLQTSPETRPYPELCFRTCFLDGKRLVQVLKKCLLQFWRECLCCRASKSTSLQSFREAL